jgi:ABC-type phosphate/phosphonate transport system substrate-binding protein
VVRADDPRQTLADFDGAPFAYNEALSQSGWAAPQTHAARAGIQLPPAVMTGGHRLSAQAVAEGRADIAALDAVTHMLLLDSDPGIARLRVIAATDPTPGLPFITAQGGPAEALFRVIESAIPALAPQDRATLHLKGLARIPTDAYLAVPNPPAPKAFAPSD